MNALASDASWHIKLRKALVSYFDENDLRTLCFDLKVDYESLGGEGKAQKIVELIKFFARTGRITDLIDYCQTARPNVAWAEIRASAVAIPLLAESQPDIVTGATTQKAALPAHSGLARWIKIGGVIAVAVVVLVVAIKVLLRPQPAIEVPPSSGTPGWTAEATGMAETARVADATARAPAAQPLPPAPTPTTAQPSQPPPEPTEAPKPTLPAGPALEVHATQLQFLEGYFARQIAWSLDGKWIAIRSYDIPFLDAKTTKEVYRITSVQWPSSLAFSPDGKTLAYAGDQVAFVQPGTWGELGALSGSGGTKVLAYSPDGRRLATAIGEVVKLWDLSSGKEERVFPGTSGNAVAFSPDGKMVAAAGGIGGGEIKRWNAETGEELPPLKGHTNWIDTLEFSPDGRILASGSVDQSIRLWDVATGRLRTVLNGHTGQVTDVAFSPDGRLLASASWDLTVKLWDVATGAEVQSLLGHPGWVQAVAFSPDGRLLASGADDGVRLWSIESGGATRGTVTLSPEATGAAAAQPSEPTPTSTIAP